MMHEDYYCALLSPWYKLRRSATMSELLEVHITEQLCDMFLMTSP